ncbi:MAG TPA: phospholipid carrier-dependent glycosyltransferase [Verrucomicrobiae bacterium]|nr:phospholipid carrier-dependent glycosyltransferase [Verrucomicrobiae bacterium]
MAGALSGAVLLFLVLFAIARILAADQTIAQGFDEPCHIAAGMKWLDEHDYTLDPLHPPLARDAIALPLYLAGERFPEIKPEEGLQGYCTELGNTILSNGGRYRRNLSLARAGVLPFLCVCAILVFLWAGQEGGKWVGCVASFLFLTHPSVLAFSGLAYTDAPTMCTQFAAIFAFAMWLKKPTRTHMILLGVAVGLALSSKLTSFLFLPSAFAAMALVKLLFVRRENKETTTERTGMKQAASLLAATCIAMAVLWGSYAFSVGRLDSALALSQASQRAGGSGSVWRRVRMADPVIPAPDLIRGMHVALQKNEREPESYLLGNARSGGWWYFFPVAVALKTPLPVLILALIGLLFVLQRARQDDWPALLPPVAVAAVFGVTAFVTLQVGTRHVLVVLPILSVLAGWGAALLWSSPGVRRRWGRAALVLLLAWQTAATIRAQGDLLAYFNELAPADPGEVLVKGCDLDCGQDVFRLREELRLRGVARLGIGVCTSADLALADFPTLDILPPRKAVVGWVAVSVRALKTGSFRIYQNGRGSPNEQYPHDALSWLEKYRPIARVGKTIFLYYIPEKSVGDPTQASR